MDPRTLYLLQTYFKRIREYGDMFHNISFVNLGSLNCQHFRKYAYQHFWKCKSNKIEAYKNTNGNKNIKEQTHNETKSDLKK